MSTWIKSEVLRGELVRLEPLSQHHAQGLYNRGRSAADWAYMPRPCFVDLADTRQWIEDMTNRPDRVAFAIIEAGKDRAVGSSSYLNLRPEHLSLEIGYTWLGQEWQRTAVNTQAKLLLMTHAFERLNCNRVEFKTDLRNERSQRALQRIGATREGVLRAHMVTQGGYLRDSVYFSVIRSEWPQVKEHLLALTQR